MKILRSKEWWLKLIRRTEGTEDKSARGDKAHARSQLDENVTIGVARCRSQFDKFWCSSPLDENGLCAYCGEAQVIAG